MITSFVNGNKVEYKNGKWQYVDFDNAPESWFDRCSGDGHERYSDEEGNKRYSDTNEVVKGFRPCSKCGHYPNEQGDDWCLGHLGNVMNACCGHGVHKGYIQFDSGVTIRGYFEVEYNDVVISKMETTSCEACSADYVYQEDWRYCPKCGRRLEETT